MRIRKHAKISPLLYASSTFLQQHGTVLHSHLHCQFNQSPWDVLTFPLNEQEDHINQQSLLPPPPVPSSSYQLDGYDSYAVNGTSYDSEQSITSMKLDNNTEMKEMNYFNNNNVADVPAVCDDFEMEELGLEKDRDNNNVTTMCCKNDGKRLQCIREAKKGHTLCEHHFAQVKKHYSSNNSAHSTTTTTVTTNSNTKLKQTVAAAESVPSSCGRPHRPKKSSSSEFYYYSGFGPLWGKKRGPSTGKNNAGEINSSDSTTHGAQSSSSQMDNEGFDYDDNDDEEVEKCKIKRARKPIKARSLKSLM
ncbi:hypothetical protein RND71_020269 [Anisodus tanguticus]|uniref:WRC domain-containing protein n=1 Tax=Anisodus tanguticus TaxID=243964 RepID=A0AAE1S142_9SOLA|nr:hypothetical protein RND71_020269 [Anisodus tanguticus]